MTLSPDDLLARLTAICDAKFGGSPYRWSRAARMNESTLRNFFDGLSRDMRAGTLKKLADGAGMTVSEMLDPKFPPEGHHSPAIHLHDRLRWVREALELTPEEVAGAVGVEPEIWAEYESGTSEPPLSVLADFKHRCLRAGLSVTLDFFSDGDQTGVQRELLLDIAAAHPEFHVLPPRSYAPRKRSSQSADEMQPEATAGSVRPSHPPKKKRANV